MANFVDSTITKAGDLAIARILAGEQITFTKIQLGDGRMSAGASAHAMTALVSPRADVDVVKCEPETEGMAVIGGVFVNTLTPSGFEWRELGLWADMGEGEFLFSYGNAGEFCDYIPGSGGGTVIEKVIDVFTYVGDKANVTALIRADSYATIEQYLALKAEVQASTAEAAAATELANGAADAPPPPEVAARRQAEFEQIRINAQSIRTVLLSESQYDPVSRTPTIEGEQGVTYYIPSDDPQENNVYVEWQYLLRSDGSEVWEMFGRGSTVPDAITAADIDAVCSGGSEPVGTRTLTLTGLKYLVLKLKNLFAALAHKHSAGDITSGAFGTARIADGAVTEAKLAPAVRECITQIEWRTYSVPAQSWASGTVGTRATQVTVQNTAVAGMEIIDAIIANPASTSSYLPIVFLSGGGVLVNFYRATSGAYKNTTYPQEMNVLVAYAKRGL